MIETKICKDCLQEKPIAEFNFRKDRNNYYTYCKTCDKSKKKPISKEVTAERARKWYAKNKEKAKLNTLAYREAHPEWWKEQQRKAEVKRKSQKAEYRLANKEKRAAYNSQWKKDNKDKVSAQNRRRWSTLKANGEKFTEQEWQTLKAIYDFSCLMCCKREPEIILTPDHVVPLVANGSNSIENIQPLCLSCNCKKGKNHFDLRYWSKDAVKHMVA